MNWPCSRTPATRSLIRQPSRSPGLVRSNNGTLRRIAATMISRGTRVSPVWCVCKAPVSFANRLSRQHPFSPHAMLVHAVGDHFGYPQRVTSIPPVHSRSAARDDAGQKLRNLIGEAVLSRDLDRVKLD